MKESEGHGLNVLLESPNKHTPSLQPPAVSPTRSCGSRTPKPSEHHLMTAHASLKCASAFVKTLNGLEAVLLTGHSGRPFGVADCRCEELEIRNTCDIRRH
ncbi:hypothetical protein IRJ41_008810 [Triplophysa rosa]|uniref:Uncharacterized protein n=1 Tax=Triplophysa rosa TaxID=992332 RepID=A0A9W7TER1_TRIRA|nr:hypothetical protein IRJ41_008810 [Triplophysa rosa]